MHLFGLRPARRKLICRGKNESKKRGGEYQNAQYTIYKLLDQEHPTKSKSDPPLLVNSNVHYIVSDENLTQHNGQPMQALLGETDLDVEPGTRVRPRKKLKKNSESDEEEQRSPLSLLSNITRPPIIGQSISLLDSQ